MKALITGASSGIGKEMAIVLAQKGYDLVLVARRIELLTVIKEELVLKYKINVDVCNVDLLDLKAVKELINKYPDIDFLINNAGFGKVGLFQEISLEDELRMIDLNIKSLHYLTKEYYRKMALKGGNILNVSSIAGFQSGPLMATYYGTKGYVLQLSEALYYEAKKNRIPVCVSCLCPGPTKTEFDQVAEVTFALKGDDAHMVAKKGIEKALKGKRIIIPTLKLKFLIFIERFVSRNFLLKIIYHMQKKKVEEE